MPHEKGALAFTFALVEGKARMAGIGVREKVLSSIR